MKIVEKQEENKGKEVEWTNLDMDKAYLLNIKSYGRKEVEIDTKEGKKKVDKYWFVDEDGTGFSLLGIAGKGLFNYLQKVEMFPVKIYVHFNEVTDGEKHYYVPYISQS